MDDCHFSNEDRTRLIDQLVYLKILRTIIATTWVKVDKTRTKRDIFKLALNALG